MIKKNALGFDFALLENYEFVKQRLVVRLNNSARSFSDGRVLTPIADLNISYHIDLGEDSTGCAQAVITKELLKLYGIDEDQLYNDALDSSPEVLPAKICSMLEILFGVEEEDPEMLVVTNERRVLGASAVLYDGVLDELADRLDDDVLILPSSIHEVIAVRASMFDDFSEAAKMVQQINGDTVKEEDRLSDNVYLYNRKTKHFGLAQL